MDLRPWIWTTALLSSLLLAGLTLATAAPAHADERGEREEHDDDDDDDGFGRGGSRGARLPAGVAPVDDALTRAECGSCHMAYPAGLLPARSWVTLMGGLSDHFGDDASLPTEQVQAITAWLVANAADTRPDHALAWRITQRTPPDQVPLRILEVPWLRHEHAGIPSRLVADNPQVKSLSACGACHAGAAEGRFDEDEVAIPGAPGWED
ncbi:diheme cytochrome c [Myxococcota bacterium]|nr:diheme cytochrome c [Myxococcota bacterium]